MSDNARKETISRSAEATFAHKNAHDREFAMLTIRLQPLPRDSGIEFASVVQAYGRENDFLPAIEAAIRKSAMSAGSDGCGVVDFSATVTDIRYHEIDSNERTFTLATEVAFRQALREAALVTI